MIIARIEEMMKKAGCAPAQIARFSGRVREFLSSDDSTIPESAIEPVRQLTHLDEIEPDPTMMNSVAMVKLNGGLGTSMGLTGPKGMLEVKDGHDFYAICHGQIKSRVSSEKVRPPLIFMNSFNTEKSTRQRLQELGFEQKIPWDFRQSQVPKIKPDGSLPEVEKEYAWCPPGHGDIYASLLDSGLKERLLENGIRYLFVSNIDNLGAVLDSRPLAYMVKHGLGFLMEVTRRGENDRKGGHLALDKNEGLVLREIAQCPPEDLESFQDIDKHRFFNTNNLWIDLTALDESWTDLSLIVNRKPVRPHEPESTEIVQLEQAMGAAISIVEKADAIEVGRDRFLPVKTTNDLFLLRSDLFELDSDFSLRQQSDTLPRIDLDSEHYKMIDGFERLVEAVPSLVECLSLTVEGPVAFRGSESLKGHVRLRSS